MPGHRGAISGFLPPWPRDFFACNHGCSALPVVMAHENRSPKSLQLRRREILALAGMVAAGGTATAAGRAANPNPCERALFRNARDFGVRGDARTDDLPAIAAALAQFAEESPVAASGDNLTVPGATLYFPPGRYFLSRTLSLKHQVRLLGEARGIEGAAATTFEFPPDITGILINRHNTEAQVGLAQSSTSAAGTTIEGIAVAARAGSNATSQATGIYSRAQCNLRSCRASGFARDGIALVANEQGPQMGNANSSVVRDCSVISNGRHGFYVSGDNVNACTIESLDSVYNGSYGFFDETSIGQTWIGGHSASNGQLDSGLFPTTSIVWHGGAIYALLPGREAEGAGLEPGTDPSVWSIRERVLRPFPNIPPWRRGIRLCSGGAGFLRAGRHVHVNAYTEGRQGPYFNDGAVIIGGSPGAGFVGRGINIYNSEGRLTSESASAERIYEATREAWARLNAYLPDHD